MKKVYRILVCLLGVLVLAGCSDSNVPDSFRASLSGHSLRLSNSSISFDARGGVENLTVTANNVKWRFSDLPYWLSASPLSGTSTASVTFTAKENLSTDTTRTSIFYLESIAEDWNYKVPISATQAAMAAQLTVATNSVQFSGGSGNQIINVVSNTDWDASTSASWIRAEPSQDKSSVRISVEDNPTDASRTAIVTLSAGGRATVNINVVQESAGVTGSTETLRFEKEGGTLSTTITADAGWETKTSNSWISVSPTSGNAGSHTLHITASENSSVSERTGFVYVVIGTSTKLQIPISQKGLFLETSINNISFSADSEQKQLSINSNFDWAILSKPDWLSISPMEGLYNQTITITSQKNENEASRRGTITIGKEGLPLYANIDVVQEGMTLSVDNNRLEFADKASTQTITIATIAEWNANSNEDWIHLSKVNGIGNYVLSVSVDENTSENSRTGSIKLSAGDLTQTISVIQCGKYFYINTGDKTFTSTGGTMQISFSTNESWTAVLEQGAAWLTLSSTSGNGDGVITITIKDNASMKARETAIVISPSNSSIVKVFIKQSGRYLTVDCSELKFGQFGGTSELITISTDGSFTISAKEDWIGISKATTNSFTITASENSGKGRTGKIVIELTGLANGEQYETNISVSQEGNDLNGHEYVDLGLSVYWSVYNIGASSNTEAGNYLNWQSASTEVSKWGGKWRLPTKDEFQELIDKCSISSVTISGKQVAKFTGPNGKSIYFPLAGINLSSGIEMVGDKGFYWSNTEVSSSHYCLDVRSNYAYVYSMVNDTWLMNVKPVANKK